MTRFLFLLLALGLAPAFGCEQGSSTARSTDPNRPESKRQLTVTSPGSQTVTQDKSDEMTVSIDRKNFSGPVNVELRNLPAGVSVVTRETTIPADKSSIVLTIQAGPKADPVKEHSVTVVARAGQEADLPEATTTFKLDVKSK